MIKTRFKNKRKLELFFKIPRLIPLVYLLLNSGFMFGQNINLSGTVHDENGEGIPGASILIKGTNSGTTTDVNGVYTISVPKDAILVVSYVGYDSKEIQVNGQSKLDIVLSTGTSALDEILVVGYGTQKKRDVTGAVTSVSESTLKEVPAPNLLNQLKGRAAGVSIVSNGSTPGSQGQIRIRGNRTLATNNNDALDGPLVVVDGIPYGGLNDINPDDIQSMEILKDASATAIYGSRGAGGVILITTKRGKTGKATITYDGYHGITNILDKYRFMNATEYAKFKDDAAKYNTVSPGTTPYPLTAIETANQAAGVNTDWQNLMYQQGFNTNHQIGVQGGTDNTQYSMGLGYYDEKGIIISQDFKRASVRITLDQKLGKSIKIGLNTINTLSYTNNPAGGGVPSFLATLSPLAKPYNDDGTVNLFPKLGSIDAAQVSPLTLVSRASDILSRTRNIRTFNSLYGEVTILDGLKYRFNAGLNFSQSQFNGYGPPNTYVNNATVQSASNADVSNNEFWDINLQHLLYYDKIFAQKHKLSLTGLFEITKNHSVGSAFNVKGVPADYIGSSNFGLASGTVTANATNGTNYFAETGLLSYMGRANYTYNGKYMLTATFRRDGSSTLSPGNQYFNYPAIGLGWNVSDEPFMRSVNFISNLKLRGGWGISGNRNVGAYATLGALSSATGLRPRRVRRRSATARRR